MGDSVTSGFDIPLKSARSDGTVNSRASRISLKSRLTAANSRNQSRAATPRLDGALDSARSDSTDGTWSTHLSTVSSQSTFSNQSSLKSRLTAAHSRNQSRSQTPRLDGALDSARSNGTVNSRTSRKSLKSRLIVANSRNQSRSHTPRFESGADDVMEVTQNRQSETSEVTPNGSHLESSVMTLEELQTQEAEATELKRKEQADKIKLYKNQIQERAALIKKEKNKEIERQGLEKIKRLEQDLKPELQTSQFKSEIMETLESKTNPVHVVVDEERVEDKAFFISQMEYLCKKLSVHRDYTGTQKGFASPPGSVTNPYLPQQKAMHPFPFTSEQATMYPFATEPEGRTMQVTAFERARVRRESRR